MDNPWKNDSSQDPQGQENAQENERTRPQEQDPFSFTPVQSSPIPHAGGFTPVQDDVPPVRKHSGLGIASFILFGVMAVAFVALLVAFITQLASVIDFSDPDAVQSEEVTQRIQDMPELAVILFLMLGTFAGNLIGLVLGIVGCVQRERKKVFAVLGTVFNGLVIGFLALMFIIGLILASAV
ncbi:hypothetical protein [Gorillibacterium sp. sgz5001074]|uniref:hypothetical protein n=1 Tax=Gorillibacterium sp. sgz5001074 TaxID=3446695 RepID=UPI003F6765E7